MTGGDCESHINVSQTGGLACCEEQSTRKARLMELFDPQLFSHENWADEMCEILFNVKERGSSIQAELYFGFVHFMSCLYVLAVIPQQLSKARYQNGPSIVATSVCCGIGSIICGLLANLPFVIAPPSVVSIYLAVSMQEKDLIREHGDSAVMLSGVFLMLVGWKPMGHFIGKLIPLPIQVGTALGIGLLTALAGATEVHLVENGKFQLLTMGKISPEMIISLAGVIIISVAIHYEIKGAFCIALAACTGSWWAYADAWPGTLAAWPQFLVSDMSQISNTTDCGELTFDLVFLYVLYLSGMIVSLGSLGGLVRDDGETPRARWIYVISGLMTILSGYLSGAPVLISPESAAAIKAGAKTGLSTVVCGVLFLSTIFFYPIFRQVPAAGTSPVLLMIGTLLFQNVGRVDWKRVEDAVPAFFVLFFIPFTYSVLTGVGVGYCVYLAIGLFTGTLRQNMGDMLAYYFPDYFVATGERQMVLLEGYRTRFRSRSRSRSLPQYTADGVASISPQPLPPRSRLGSVQLTTVDDLDLDPSEVSPQTLSELRSIKYTNFGFTSTVSE